LADQLSSLTNEARHALAFVVRHGDETPGFSSRNGLAFPLKEMARRTRVSSSKIRGLFDELERLGFGYIDMDPGFEAKPPEAVVHVPADDPRFREDTLHRIRSYCEKTATDLDKVIVHLRFNLLD